MTSTHPKFKAACVQAAPIFMDLKQTIDKAIGLMEEASKKGARLIAFPETWIPGYPWFIWLGPPIWGFQFVQRYHDNSLRTDSPEMKALRDSAKANNIVVVMGYSEKDAGSLYMGQALIGADGKLLFTRRKLKPTHAERTIFGEGDGSDFQVKETEIGHIGALNCWEHLQPLSKYAMYSLNEQIHVASWPSFTLYRGLVYALGPEIALSASQMYAAEGQCFVLCSTAVTSQRMFDMLCDTPDKSKLLNPQTGKPGGGFGMIYGPDGEPLCEHLPEDQEGILYADLDLSKIILAKAADDPVGHYSRPDVVRLLLNRTKGVRVHEFQEPLKEIVIKDGSDVISEKEKESSKNRKAEC